MAISRLTETTLQSGFPKFDTFWDGRSAVGSMEPISAITLTGSQSTVEFNNIPGTYSHLQIRGFVRSSRSAASDQLFIRFNGDAAGTNGTNGNYSIHRLSGDGANATAASDINRTEMEFYPLSAASQTAGNFGVFVIDVLDYANTNKYKTARILGGSDFNGSGTVFLFSGAWRNTAAVTSIQLPWQTSGSTFISDSSISLYGIK